MRFPQRLNRKLISEWKEAYIAYVLLKTYLSPFKIARKGFSTLKMRRLSDAKKNVNLHEEILLLKDFEGKFSALISSEMEKVTLFLDFKMDEIECDYDLMKMNKAILDKKYSEDQTRQYRVALTEFYKKVSKLIQFVNLNREGFAHILRKHKHYTSPFAKNLELTAVSEVENTINIIFPDQQSTLEHTQKEIETLYTELYFTPFTSDEGVKELKRAAHTKGISRKDATQLFFFMGCTFTLFLVLAIIWIGGLINYDEDSSFKDIFQMFRGSLLIILYFWLLSWNVYCWTLYHINYRKLFKFNQHYSTIPQVFKRAAFFLAVWVFMFLWYIVCREKFSSLGQLIPKEYTPLVVYITILLYLAFPSKKFLNGRGRGYMYRLLLRTLLCLCYPVDFPVEWAADQMISFVIPVQDIQFTICYYSAIWDKSHNNGKVCKEQLFIAGFLMASIPYLIRVIQLTRKMRKAKSYWGSNMAMLLNYVLAFFVVCVSNLSGRFQTPELRYLWIALAIICTTTSYVIDLKMAWMFLEKDSKVILVRDKRIFSRPIIYYGAMFSNFVLRCSWVFSISPDIVAAFSSPEIFIFLMALLEIIRRAIWNMFRVEKEQIVACSSQLHTREPCGFPNEEITYLKGMDGNTCSGLFDQSGKVPISLEDSNNGMNNSRLIIVRELDKLRVIGHEQDGVKDEIVIKDPLLRSLAASRNLDCSNPLLTKNDNEIKEKFLSNTSIDMRQNEADTLVKRFEKKLRKDLGLTKSLHVQRSFLNPDKKKVSMASESEQSLDPGSVRDFNI